MNIIEISQNIFEERVKKLGKINDLGNPDPYGLISHVKQVERWANFLCDKYPQADRQVVILAVWLHDIGHYPISENIDHAIKSESLAQKIFIKEGYSKRKMPQVLHCIRAHRCRDVMPETIEAKIVACADSASHMTDSLYMNMAKDDRVLNLPFRVYGKIDRDFRDVAMFPEVKKMIKPLYLAWKKVIKEYEKIDI